MLSEKKKVLVVDDNPVYARLVSAIFSEYGLEVRSAADGLTALDTLQDFRPDILCTDFIMPRINGKVLCSIFRQTPELAKVFIIVLSSVGPENQQACQDFDADICIAKGPDIVLRRSLGQAIGHFQRGERRIQGFLGAEQLHARAITSELLYITSHYDALFNNMSDGLLELDENGRITSLNDAARNMLPVASHLLWGDVLHRHLTGPEAQRLEGCFSPGGKCRQTGSSRMDFAQPFHLGERRVLLQLIRVQAESEQFFLVILRDITEMLVQEENRRTMERELVKLRTMEAIGLMAGSVAHDLNNILVGTMGYSELLQGMVAEDHSLSPYLQEIRSASQRAAGVISDLLAIVRGGAAKEEAVDLNREIEGYLTSAEFGELLRRLPGVSCSVDTLAQSAVVRGSRVRLFNCLHNLVHNAFEALHDHGCVRISTALRHLAGPESEQFMLAPGDYVLLTVTDDGPGIPPEDLERVFQPYFSKKAMGRSGTGLGLTAVWNTARDHGGTVTVSSAAQGACFQVYLPATPAAPPAAAASAPSSVAGPPRGHGELVLVVDDQKMQRDVASAILTRLGYQVVTQASGEEAVVYLQEQEVALVLLDMQMEPGMNGRETHERIMAIRPGLRVIVVSGFAEHDEFDHLRGRGVRHFLSKPYSLEDLAAAVAQALREPALP